ncbi:hypothetical protein LCGC14_1809460 [marine sediment metagenome]|uniref:Uncharacterized protein n=1 Tax=marine sediment metagenome TaxID=412755 RepID=A0A0F9GMC8_9ZZZZ
MEEPQTIKIEGVTHEWLDNSECDFNKCKRNKAEITWCDDCDIAFCKEHIDYHNDYKEGKTYCPDCWSLKKRQEVSPDSSNRLKPVVYSGHGL